MKLPLNTAREYTEINLSNEEVEKIISTKVGEVESVTDYSKAYEGIYIGEIVEKKDHPDADKLAIYQVNIGEEQIQVVAGDKGLEVGDKVAYIKPASIVPSTYNTAEEFVIKAVKMRGEISNGMVCSEKELNLGPDHSKVLKLSSDAPVGVTFSEYYDFNDTVIDIENKALTNRGDLFGIVGLARELSAAQGIKFESPQWYKRYTLDLSPERNCLALEIRNEIENICPRYMGITMDSIEIGDSPIWLKSVLLKTGIKPINNVVDITNYLMILTGQPLHAFDYDKLIKNDPNADEIAYITVRLAKDGERLHTLDDKVVELNSNTIVIADSTNPIAIGGMIGGVDTEIDENTKRVVIESANFDRFNIRRSSMAYGINTDAVTRYTRAQDPQQCLPVLGKAVELIKEIANGVVSSEVVDIYPLRHSSKDITILVQKMNSHLGTLLTKDSVEEILTNLEYTVVSSEDDYLTVTPPTFRRDVLIAEDIHEDIGRIYGYDSIKPTLPLRSTKAPSLNKNIEIKQKIRNILSNSGCNEINTYSFVSQTLIERANQNVNLAYHLRNAQSPDLEFMRPSLLISMLDKAQQNVYQNISQFCLYEFNISHQKGYTDKFELPAEDWHMSLLFTTREENSLAGNPYYQVKEYFEKVVSKLGVSDLEYELTADVLDTDIPIWIKNIIPSFDRNSSAVISQYDGNKKIYLGIVGNINGDVKKNFKLPTFTGALEINLEVLKKIKTKTKQYKETSKYPAIFQDISFTVKVETKYKDIEDIIVRTLINRRTNVNTECLDIYQKSRESETKNITIRLTMQHLDKTLTTKDMEKTKKVLDQKLSKYI